MYKQLTLAMMMALSACLVSCDDDDDPAVDNTTKDPASVSFIVTSGDPEADLTGGSRMKVFSDLTTTKTDQIVYTDTDNSDVVLSYDNFTQVTYNQTSGVFTGYIYARGSSEQGIGSTQAGLRSYKVQDGKLVEIADPVKVSAFGNTGTYGTFSYAAQISQPEAMVVSNTGAGTNITVGLPTYAIDEVNPNISNIVDMGSNQVAMVLNYSNRDSAVVAFCDYDLNIQKVIYDGRIGASVGAMRSVRYTQSGADDEGNVYVFSGSAATDSKVGALRINKGTTEFDTDYYFNIFEAADGYRFRKAFHISGDKFLLEFYLEKDAYGNMNASGKLAVVDMSEKSLTWVTGIPDPTTVSFGWGDGFDGNYYLPVSAPTSMSGGSGSGSGNRGNKATSTVTPTIYAIDAETGVATAFMTFNTNELIRAISIIKK